MRRRALIPLRKYHDFQTATVGWLTKEILLDDLALRELQEHTLSSAWRYWLSNNDLSLWNVEGDEFLDHASAYLVRQAAEELFVELSLFVTKYLNVTIDNIDDVGISFDNISIDYVTVRNQNATSIARRPTYGFGSFI